LSFILLEAEPVSAEDGIPLKPTQHPSRQRESFDRKTSWLITNFAVQFICISTVLLRIKLSKNKITFI
jgi:hypothetical protein